MIDSSRRRADPTRFAGVDVARGVALLGMIAAHALVVATEDGAPTGTYLVVGGRAAALFAVLAGVAMAFMTRRRQVRGGPDGRAATATLLTRAALLLVLGLALGWTDIDIAAVILPYYAVMFALAVPLVRLSNRALVATGSVIVVAVPLLSQLVRSGLPAAALDANPGFGQLVTDPLGLLLELTLTGTYPALPWTAYLCAGIVAGRMDLGSVRTAARLAVTGAGAAIVATGLSWLLLVPGGGLDAIGDATSPDQLSEAPSVLDHVILMPSGTTPTDTWWWLAAAAPHSSTPLDLVATIGSSFAVLGVAILLGRLALRAPVLRAVLMPLGAAGSMTLTLYTASILFMNSPLDDLDPVPGYLVQVVGALVFAAVWRTLVGRGPVESVVTAITHRVRDAARGRREAVAAG